MRPQTRYAKSGDINIAYQVIGDGPLDLVYVPGWISNVEYAWEHPVVARFLEQLGSFARLIVFDKRGTGLSDREVGFPTLEERIDDVRAVMDAVGSKRAALLGTSEGANMSVLYAATYPERTVALVLFGSFARRTWSTDYPWAPTPQERARWIEDMERNWGGEVSLERMAPSAVGDQHYRQWFSTYLRYGASPRAALALVRLNSDIDTRNVLPAVRVPTLVLHRQGDRHVNVQEGRYLADHIPNAKFIELPGEDHTVWIGDQDAVLGEIQEFLTGVRPEAHVGRVLLTVLFTDIVDSTSAAARLGDCAWRDLLDRHDTIVRQELMVHRGREVNTTGDGFLAVFDGPARAVYCSAAIREAVRSLGLEIRAGVHIGECEQRGDNIGGIAVHIAARILALTEPGEILASETIKDLTVGSGIDFLGRGEHKLKGVPGDWPLFRVDLPAAAT